MKTAKKIAAPAAPAAPANTNPDTIADLLKALRDCADRNESKRIRRRLRSLGHWGGQKTVAFQGDAVKIDAPRVAAIAATKPAERERAARARLATASV